MPDTHLNCLGFQTPTYGLSFTTQFVGAVRLSYRIKSGTRSQDKAEKCWKVI